jgi:hypothetical protein
MARISGRRVTLIYTRKQPLSCLGFIIDVICGHNLPHYLSVDQIQLPIRFPLFSSVILPLLKPGNGYRGHTIHNCITKQVRQMETTKGRGGINASISMLGAS